MMTLGTRVSECLDHKFLELFYHGLLKPVRGLRHHRDSVWIRVIRILGMTVQETHEVMSVSSTSDTMILHTGSLFNLLFVGLVIKEDTFFS